MVKMKVSPVCAAVLVTFALMSSAPSAEGSSLLDALLPQLGSAVGSLWQNEQFELLDQICYFESTPSFYRWELYHTVKVYCPGWAPFKGRGKSKSKSGSLQDAIKDFLQQAVAAGLVTEEEASLWL